MSVSKICSENNNMLEIHLMGINSDNLKKLSDPQAINSGKKPKNLQKHKNVKFSAPIEIKTVETSNTGTTGCIVLKTKLVTNTDDVSEYSFTICILGTQLESLKNIVNPPVCIPSIRPKEGNFHVSLNDRLIFVFVQPRQKKTFQELLKDSPNHILVVLPLDDCGICFTRQCIKSSMETLLKEYAPSECNDLYFMIDDDIKSEVKFLEKNTGKKNEKKEQTIDFLSTLTILTQMMKNCPHIPLISTNSPRTSKAWLTYVKKYPNAVYRYSPRCEQFVLIRISLTKNASYMSNEECSQFCNNLNDMQKKKDEYSSEVEWFLEKFNLKTTQLKKFLKDGLPNNSESFGKYHDKFKKLRNLYQDVQSKFFQGEDWDINEQLVYLKHLPAIILSLLHQEYKLPSAAGTM